MAFTRKCKVNVCVDDWCVYFSKLPSVTAVCLSTDSLNLLLAADDGSIRVLDVLTFKLKDTVIQQESLIQQ